MAHEAPLPPRANGVACTINHVPTFWGLFFAPFSPSILPIQHSQLPSGLKQLVRNSRTQSHVNLIHLFLIYNKKIQLAIFTIPGVFFLWPNLFNTYLGQFCSSCEIYAANKWLSVLCITWDKEILAMCLSGIFCVTNETDQYKYWNG